MKYSFPWSTNNTTTPFDAKQKFQEFGVKPEFGLMLKDIFAIGGHINFNTSHRPNGYDVDGFFGIRIQPLLTTYRINEHFLLRTEFNFASLYWARNLVTKNTSFDFMAGGEDAFNLGDFSSWFHLHILNNS